ncbi:MAG: hypothetical protein ABI550_01985 [Ignavibacteriaceae bacterium]
METKILIFFIIFLSLIFNGCLRTYYPSIYQTSASPTVFNNENSSDRANKYLSADVTLSKGSYENENLQIMKLSYLIVDTRDYFNFNFEGFGYTGLYRVSGINEQYDGVKNLIGFGGDMKFSGNFKIGKFKMGLGTNLGVGLEFGEYYDFRISAGNSNLISDENSLGFLIFSFFPVLCYDISDRTNISAQMNLGLPGFVSPSITLNNEGNVYWLSWLPDNDNNNSKKFYGQRIVFGVMVNMNDFALNY